MRYRFHPRFISDYRLVIGKRYVRDAVEDNDWLSFTCQLAGSKERHHA